MLYPWPIEVTVEAVADWQTYAIPAVSTLIGAVVGAFVAGFFSYRATAKSNRAMLERDRMQRLADRCEEISEFVSTNEFGPVKRSEYQGARASGRLVPLLYRVQMWVEDPDTFGQTMTKIGKTLGNDTMGPPGIELDYRTASVIQMTFRHTIADAFRILGRGRQSAFQARVAQAYKQLEDDRESVRQRF